MRPAKRDLGLSTVFGSQALAKKLASAGGGTTFDGFVVGFSQPKTGSLFLTICPTYTKTCVDGISIPYSRSKNENEWIAYAIANGMKPNLDADFNGFTRLPYESICVGVNAETVKSIPGFVDTLRTGICYVEITGARLSLMIAKDDKFKAGAKKDTQPEKVVRKGDPSLSIWGRPNSVRPASQEEVSFVMKNFGPKLFPRYRLFATDATYPDPPDFTQMTLAEIDVLTQASQPIFTQRILLMSAFRTSAGRL